MRIAVQPSFLFSVVCVFGFGTLFLDSNDVVVVADDVAESRDVVDLTDFVFEPEMIGETISIDDLKKSNDNFRSFNMKGALLKNVPLKTYANLCATALLQGAQFGKSAAVRCVNIKSSNSGCYRPNSRNFYCVFNSVTISNAPNSNAADSIKETLIDVVNDGKFAQALWTYNRVDARFFETTGGSSPTRKPVSSPTRRPTSPTKKPSSPTRRPTSPTRRPTSPTKKPTDGPSAKCSRLADDCLEDEEDDGCIAYLQEDDCARCGGKDSKESCYKKTGKVFAEVGWATACERLFSPGGVNSSKACKNLYKKCTKKNKKDDCVKYMKNNKCTSCKKGNKDKCYKNSGKVFDKAGGYDKVCD